MKIVLQEDTDGDKILIVLDPRIIRLRKTARLTYLAVIDKAGKPPQGVSAASMKMDYALGLRDAGVGRITVQTITCRDIQLMLKTMPGPNGEVVLPEIVREQLGRNVYLAKKALKTASLHEADVECCKVVAGLEDILPLLKSPESRDIWTKRINKACEYLLQVYRRLQEMAIAIPKTGVWVDIPSYKWAWLQVRPTWYRPSSESGYDSWSPLGRLHDYVKEQWGLFKIWAADTAKRIQPLLDIDTTGYEEAYSVIHKLKGEFGTELHDLDVRQAVLDAPDYEESGDDNEDDDNLLKQEKDELFSLYTNLMAAIVQKFKLPIDVAAALVYRASYDNAKGLRYTQGFTFMWGCFGEEIVETLRHLSADPTVSLLRVTLDRAYKGHTLIEGSVEVEKGVVSMQETRIGRASVANGAYEMKNDKNGLPFLIVVNEKKAVEKPVAKVVGKIMPVIGFRHHSLSYVNKEGAPTVVEKLDKAWAIQLLTRSRGLCTAYVRPSKTGGLTVYLATKFMGEWVLFGNIPSSSTAVSDDTYWAELLNDRQFRVSIVKDAKQSESAIRLELTEYGNPIDA